MTITLGYVFIVVAFVDLVAGSVMVRAALAAPGIDDARRRSIRMVMAAIVVVSILLVLIALFLPIGRMPLT
jgi:hypothetical protein